MSPRAEQKQQTRQALMDAARNLMDSGRGFGSLSLREVSRTAGIVPTGFYRHFQDMDELGLALVAEVDATFRSTLREVRRSQFEMGSIIEASTRIFLDAVSDNRSQFLFLAREQYGGSQPVRQAIDRLAKLAHDLLGGRLVWNDGDEIIHVPDVEADAHVVLGDVIQAVRHDVRGKLAGQGADRQADAGLVAVAADDLAPQPEHVLV